MQSNNPQKISKLYYRIGEVATMLGVEPSVLRHWESEFSSVRPSRSKSGQRVYDQRAVKRLELIKQLLYNEGYTAKGVRRYLRGHGIERRVPDDPVVVNNQRMQQTLVSVRDMLVQALDEFK